MNCEELRDHYELYVLGAADETEASEIRAHLNRNCEACSAGVNDARTLTTLLAATAAPASPRPELRNRILASVGASVEPSGSAKSKSHWALVWAAAACMAGVAAIYLAVRENQTAAQLARVQTELNQRTTEAAERSTQLTRLNDALSIVNGAETVEVSFGPGEPRPASGKVFVSPQQGVLLIASRLPAAPQGKIYEMWIVPRRGAPVPAGLFQSGPDGNALHLQTGPVDIAATGAVAVTLENEAGAQQPTPPLLIVAALMPPRGVR
jgi:anti-sigma-K factor RskA